MIYTKEKRKWRKSVKFGYSERILWYKCCVCQKNSRATIPWYRRVWFIWAGIQKKTNYFYKYFALIDDNYSRNKVVYGVCSKECLNMFYLGNEEVK